MRYILLIICMATLTGCDMFQPAQAIRSSAELKKEIAGAITESDDLWPWKNLFRTLRPGYIYEKSGEKFHKYSNQVSIYNAQNGWDLFEEDPNDNIWETVIVNKRQVNTQLEALGLDSSFERSKVTKIRFSARGDKYSSLSSVPTLERKLNDHKELFPGLHNEVKIDSKRIDKLSLPESASRYWVATGAAYVKDISITIETDSESNVSVDAAKALKKFLGTTNLQVITGSSEGSSKKAYTFKIPGSQGVAAEFRPMVTKSMDNSLYLGLGRVLLFPEAN